MIRCIPAPVTLLLLHAAFQCCLLLQDILHLPDDAVLIRCLSLGTHFNQCFPAVRCYCCLQGPLSLPEDVSSDLLQLAMNSSMTATAEAAAQRVSAQQSAGPISWLMMTAVLRGHYNAFKDMTASAAVQQRMDVPTLTVLFKVVSAYNSRCARYLGSLPAAAGLGAKAVEQLMQLCIGERNYIRLEKLSTVPAAGQLSSTAMARLLYQALRTKGIPGILSLLCGMPAASRMDARDLAQVMTAMYKGYSWCLEALLDNLPAAEQASGEIMTQLLLAALRQEGYESYSFWSLEKLCSLSAAQR
jgi:hypothetical protein